MKSRVITGILLAVGGLAIVISNNIYIYCAAAVIMGVFCTYELLKALGFIKQPFIAAVALGASAVAPVMMFDLFIPYLFQAIILYILLFFLSLILSFKKIDLIKAGILFAVSATIMLCDASILRIKAVFPDDSVYYIIILLLCAFISDTCAYFAGRLFGKHKLIPSVSPNKTVEGSIGGLTGCVIVNVLVTLLYSAVFIKNTAHVNYIALIVLSVITSIAGMIGDLAASTVKRICGIKDFGNLLPGHGGVLDRLDSMNFAVPAGFAILLVFPVIIR